jgi:L-asparagine transporter-like permease
MSKILHFQSLLVIIVLIFVNGMILMDVKAEYKLPILVFVLFILNLVLIFFGSQDQRASKNR